MIKYLLFTISVLFYVITDAQSKIGRAHEIAQFISHFEKTNAAFFQTTAAKDSIFFLLNNKSKLLQTSRHATVDTQKALFNRDLLSLELFFSAEEIENYAFDYIYRNVDFLKKIYFLYLNYPAKNINSFSSQESVALMYQVELYLYFNNKITFLNNVSALVNQIQTLYKKRKIGIAGG